MAVRYSKKTRDKLIEAYKEFGSVAGAARFIGISRFLHYDWMKRHPEYKEAFDIATEPVADLIMEELINRGMKGWIEPVFSSGKRALDFEIDERGNIVIDPKTGKPKAVPASIRKKDTACLLALASFRIPGFSQKVNGNRDGRSGTGAGKDDEDRDIEVTVVYKDKPIPTDDDQE